MDRLDEDVVFPRRKSSAFFINAIVTFFCMMMCFGLTSMMIAYVHSSFVMNESFGKLTFLAVLIIDVFVSMCVALSVGGISTYYHREYTTRQMLTPIVVVSVCFCVMYCIGEVVCSGPQAQVITVVEEVAKNDTFLLTKLVASGMKQRGGLLLFFILFPVLLVTILLDIILMPVVLPIVLITSSKMHAAFFIHGIYTIIIMGVSFVPAAWIDKTLRVRQAFQQALYDDE